MQFLKGLERKLRQWRNNLSPVFYRGNKRFCPCCQGAYSKFLPAGTKERARDDAVCPFCRSRERDRLLMLLFNKRFSELFESEKHVLHFAPEPCITKFLSGLPGVTYVTTDLIRDDVSFKADIQSLDIADASYGGAICAHVLQDVPDEAAAMREVLRVLQPGGWALFSVPLRGAVTRECDQPMNARAAWDKRPNEHIRVYGLDFADRLQSFGFEVEVIEGKSFFSTPDALVKHGLANDVFTNVLFFCRKPKEG